MGVRWHLAAALVTDPWWLTILSRFSCAYWPPECLLWRNVSSDLSSFLNLLKSYFKSLNSKCSLYILDTSLLAEVRFAHTFSRSWWYPLKHKSLKFSEVQFIYFPFHPLRFLCHIWETLPNLRSWRFPPVFSSKSFTGLALTFRSSIHLNFVHGLRKGSRSSLCMWIYSCLSTAC